MHLSANAYVDECILSLKFDVNEIAPTNILSANSLSVALTGSLAKKKIRYTHKVYNRVYALQVYDNKIYSQALIISNQ